jgi:hypothetical protein
MVEFLPDGLSWWELLLTVLSLCLVGCIGVFSLLVVGCMIWYSCKEALLRFLDSDDSDSSQS